MDKERLLENEREWRRYIVEKLERIESKLASQSEWTFAFRLVSGALFAILLVYMEYRLNTKF